MPAILEIKDRDDRGILSVALIDILNLVEPIGAGLTWSILDLEATGDLGDGKNILDLEQEIRDSATGLVVTWKEIVHLSKKVSQIINATIVGSTDGDSLPKLSDGSSLYTTSEVLLEMIDSSVWRIYVRDKEVLQRLRTAFPHAVTVTE
jgi:hypothetical protein